jgi:hypothetical protein
MASCTYFHSEKKRLFWIAVRMRVLKNSTGFSFKVVGSAREVAEQTEVIVTGNNFN